MATLTYQNPPIVEVLSPNSITSDPPKEYRSEGSYFGRNAPGTTDPCVMHGEEKKRRESIPFPANTHHRYSKGWFGHAYDAAVQAGKWPRIIYAAVGIILVGVWVAIMISFAFEEVKYEKKNLNRDLTGGAANNIRLPGSVFMKGTLRQFDPTARSLTISWSLAYVDTDNKTLLDLGTDSSNTLHLNIYRDVKAVPEDRSASSFDVAGVYRVDNITEVPIAVLGAHPFDSVTTDIDFTQAISDYPWTQPLFGYPFDKWTGQIVFAATDRDAAQQVGLNNSFIVSISDAVLSDSTFNWRIEAPNTNDTCQIVDPAAGCELHIDFTGKRPGLVIFAAMVALVVNWTTTIGIFLITCEAVVMQRTYILRETDILGVCLTALFALPSVRSILPGAPDFGAVIDLIGIIPNIIIISLCTTVIAVSKLRMHRSRQDKEE